MFGVIGRISKFSKYLADSMLSKVSVIVDGVRAWVYHDVHISYEEGLIEQLKHNRDAVLDTSDGYIILELKEIGEGKTALVRVNEEGVVTVTVEPWEEELIQYIQGIKTKIEYVEFGELNDTWQRRDNFATFKAELVAKGLVTQDEETGSIIFDDKEISKKIVYCGQNRQLELDAYLKWVYRYGRPIAEQDEESSPASHMVRNLLVGAVAISGTMFGSQLRRWGEQVLTRVDFGDIAGKALVCGSGLGLGAIQTLFSGDFSVAVLGLSTLACMQKVSAAEITVRGTTTGIASDLFASDIEVEGNYCFITYMLKDTIGGGGETGLAVYNVSDPTEPRMVRQYDRSYWGKHWDFYALAISGNYAYIANGFDGVTILDITDPADVKLAGSISALWQTIDVKVSGKYAYSAEDDSGFRSIDVTNPASPVQKSLVSGGSDYEYGVALIGNYAYVIGSGSYMTIVDIANPNSLVQIGTLSLSNKGGGRFARIFDGVLWFPDPTVNGKVMRCNISDAVNPVCSSQVYNGSPAMRSLAKVGNGYFSPSWTEQSDTVLNVYTSAFHGGNIDPACTLNLTGSPRMVSDSFTGNYFAVITTERFYVLSISEVPTDGLVAYYPFNGDAQDESGNGHHGTVYGANLTADRFGYAGKAYYFDGAANTYIRASATDFPTAERTTSIWFKADGVDMPALLGYGNGGIVSWIQTINHPLSQNCYSIQTGGEYNRLNYAYSISPVDAWYHWVITTNASGTRMYVNNILVANNSVFITNTVLGPDLGIGTIAYPTAPYQDGTVKNFVGILDDIRIYNRSLTAAEITALYQEGGETSTSDSSLSSISIPTSGSGSSSTMAPTPTSGSGSTASESLIPTDGLVAYYPFSNNADDQSGNGHHGTVYGATLTADRFGYARKAYYFDGAASTYIRASATDFPTAERTTSIWFKADSLDMPALLGYGDGGSASWIQTIGNKSCYSVQAGMGSRLLIYYGASPVGAWHHWVVTTDLGGTKIYVDNRQVISNAIFMDGTVLGPDLGIGTLAYPTAPYQDATVKNFVGTLDDIRIYNRSLTAAEITALYQEGYSPTPTPTPTSGSGSTASASDTPTDAEGNDGLDSFYVLLIALGAGLVFSVCILPCIAIGIGKMIHKRKENEEQRRIDRDHRELIRERNRDAQERIKRDRKEGKKAAKERSRLDRERREIHREGEKRTEKEQIAMQALHKSSTQAYEKGVRKEKTDPASALKYFDKALSGSLSDDRLKGQIYYHRGKVYYQLGRSAEAVADLNRAVESGERSNDLYCVLGLAYLNEKDEENALRSFSAAIDLRSGSVDAYYHRGKLLLHRGDAHRALDDFNVAIERGGGENLLEMYLLRGQARIILAMPEKAIADFDEILLLSEHTGILAAPEEIRDELLLLDELSRVPVPDAMKVETWYNKGKAYMAMSKNHDSEEIRQAYACCKKVLEIDSSHRGAVEMMDEIMRRLKSKIAEQERQLAELPLRERVDLQSEIIKLFVFCVSLDSSYDSLKIVAEAQLVELQKRYDEFAQVYRNACEEKKPKQAWKLFGEAIRLDDRNGLAYYQRGKAYRQLMKSRKKFDPAIAWGKVIRDFNRAIELGIRTAEVYCALGIAYHKQKDDEKALENLSRAVGLSNGSAVEVEARYHRGKILCKKNDRKLFDDLDIVVASRDSRYLLGAYLIRGRAKLVFNMLRDAVADFNEVIRRDSRNIEAWYNKGKACMAIANAVDASEVREAYTCFQEVLKLDVNYQEARKAMDMIVQRLAVKIDEQEGKVNGLRLNAKINLQTEIVKLCAFLANLDSRFSSLHETAQKKLAKFQQQPAESQRACEDGAATQDQAKALELFSTAIAYNDANALAYYHRGKVYQQMGIQSEAIADLQRALELGTRTLELGIRTADVYCVLGIAYHKQKDDEKALENLSRAISLSGGLVVEVEAHYHRGRILYKKNDRKSLDDLNMVVSSRDERYLLSAYLVRGRAKLAFNMLRDAVADFDEVLRRDSRNVEAWYNKGKACIAIANAVDASEVREAYTCFQEVLKLDANYQGAREAMETIIQRLTSKIAEQERQIDGLHLNAKINLQTEIVRLCAFLVNLDSRFSSLHEAAQKKLAEFQQQFAESKRACEDGTAAQNPAEALELFNAAITHDDTSAIAYYRRGKLYQKRGKQSAAIADLQRALELGTRTLELGISTADVYYALGIAYHKQKDDEKALENLSRAISLNGGSVVEVEARYHRGKILCKKNDRKSLDDLNMVVSSRDERYLLSAYLVRGRAKLAFNMARDAVADFDEVLRRDGRNVEAWYNKGKACIAIANAVDASEVREAYTCFQEVLELDVNYQGAREAMETIIQRLTSKIAEQEGQMGRLNLRDKTNVQTEIVKLYAFCASLDVKFNSLHEAAQKKLAKFQQQPAESKQAYEDGVATQDLARALKLFSAAIAYDDANVLAYYRRGKLYQQLGKQAEAIADLQRALELGVKLADLYYVLGLAYMEQNSDQQAVDAFSQVIAMDSDRVLIDAYYYRGVLRCKKHDRSALYDLETFILHVERDRDGDKNHLLQAYLKRGQARLTFSMLLDAVADFDEVLRLDSKNVMALLGKARACKLLVREIDDENQRDSAICYREVLRLDPDNQEAQSKLEEVKRALQIEISKYEEKIKADYREVRSCLESGKLRLMFASIVFPEESIDMLEGARRNFADYARRNPSDLDVKKYVDEVQQRLKVAQEELKASRKRAETQGILAKLQALRASWEVGNVKEIELAYDELSLKASKLGVYFKERGEYCIFMGNRVPTQIQKEVMYGKAVRFLRQAIELDATDEEVAKLYQEADSLLRELKQPGLGAAGSGLFQPAPPQQSAAKELLAKMRAGERLTKEEQRILLDSLPTEVRQKVAAKLNAGVEPTAEPGHKI